MSTLNVRLFGRFLIDCDGRAVDAVHGFKAQELLSYLVLFRNRPQPRETLAAMLWKDASTAQSRKYLRQTLWQLHAALKFAFRPVVVVEPEWVHVDPQADVWVDVSAFERAFLRVKEIPGERLDADGKEIVQSALDLYQGNLLEGWFQDWCLSERDRLQNMYLHLLDKLLGYCELHREYDTGVFYGELGLRHDRAHERTHQRLMRLQYLSGDRTAALRHYRHCVEAMRDELDAPPSKSTIVLYQQIQADELIHANAYGSPQPLRCSSRIRSGRRSSRPSERSGRDPARISDTGPRRDPICLFGSAELHSFEFSAAGRYRYLTAKKDDRIDAAETMRRTSLRIVLVGMFGVRATRRWR